MELSYSRTVAPMTVQRNGVPAVPAGLPRISVVVPFFNWEVSDLARRLLSMAAALPEPVPMIFVDDASPDRGYAERLWSVLSSAKAPCSMAVMSTNQGRAKVRNVLCELAETEFLLYLDCDMWPDEDDFLASYLSWVGTADTHVIYGGRSARKVVLSAPQYRLHRCMTQQRESIIAAERRLSPVFHFFSCNFLVRRDILREVPINDQFTGWGWEDVEWAARVSGRYTIRHEDNSASHLGLLTPEQILSKYDESITNYRLMLQHWPHLVKSQSLFRAAKFLQLSGTVSLAKYLAKSMASANWLPLSLRVRALAAYKASLYAPLTR